MNITNAIRNPRRSLVYLIDREAFYSRYGNTLETCFDFDAINEIQKLAARRTDIHEHLTTLYMLTVELGLKRILELGTRNGESTLALLMAASKIGGHVWSVDINPCKQARQRVYDSGFSSLWSFTQADDLSVNWTDEIDHLFIDTSHTYEQTLAELKKFEPHVRRNGIISMHDPVACPEVLSAVKEYVAIRNDLSYHIFLNNNGLAVLFKH